MSETEFEKLFKSQFVKLANIAFSIVKDRDEARDVVQSVFLQLWSRKDSLSIHSSVEAYLHRAAVNTSLNRLEKQKRLQMQDEFPEKNQPAVQPHEVNDDKTEIHKVLHREIKALPAKCQTVFSLSRFSGLSNKEIAEDLDISIKAVEKHITTALKTLRSKLMPLYKNYYIIAWLLINILLTRVGLSVFIMSY